MDAPKDAKRILFAITKANWGGAQRYVYDLAIAAGERGYEAALAYGAEGILVEKLKSMGIRTFPLPSLKRDFDLVAEWHSLKDLVFLLKEIRPDVLHVNSSKAGLTVVAARLAGIPRIIFTAHGWAFNERRPWWQRVLIYGAYTATLWLSHKTIAVSEAVRHDMAWLPFNKMSVVAHGMHAPTLLSREDARKALLPEDIQGFWIGMIAELHPTKRIEDAIDALAELSPSHPEARLVVIGEGASREALAERVKHYGLETRVHFAGFMDNAAQYLKAFDLFLLISRTEALGLALVEAGYAGIPSIAARVGGMPEVVRHKHTGLLVPAENPHALARAVRSLIEHPEEAARYGENLKKRVAEKFSKERMLEETFALYL